MNFDKNGLIIQDEGSGEPYGDTCNRTGCFYSLFFVWTQILKKDVAGTPFDKSLIGLRSACAKLTTIGFQLRRHPDVSPWNNPKNCTRDQMNPMFGALALWNYDRELWQQFKNLIKRFGFYQSTERDYPGTRKSLLPQYYKQGERYDDITIMDRSKWVWHPDGPDISNPSDWNYFLRGARSRLLLPAILIGDLFLVLETWAHILKVKRDLTYCDDLQLINKMIVAKSLQPTFLSSYATRYFMLNRPHIPNCPEISCMSGVWLYFTKGYDSRDWIDLYRPVIMWLCE